MYTLINGSSKTNNSNSEYFINYISKYLENYQIFSLKYDNINQIIDSINNSDTIILAFPLYVDSPNYHTLNFLDYIYDNNISLDDKKLYVIINCGFKEGEQNITALNIIKRWSSKVNINYNGSILIGAGEIIGKKRYKIVSRKALNYLKKFANSIKDKRKTDDIITTTSFINSKTYCLLANISWKNKAKKNNLTKEDINTK